MIRKTPLVAETGNSFCAEKGSYLSVVAADQVEDAEPFAEKMQRLTRELKQQFADSAKLEKQIRKNLKGLGYEI